MSDRPGRRESAAEAYRLEAKIDRSKAKQRSAIANAQLIRTPQRVENIRSGVDRTVTEAGAQVKEGVADVVDPEVSLGEAGSNASRRLRRIARGG